MTTITWHLLHFKVEGEKIVKIIALLIGLLLFSLVFKTTGFNRSEFFIMNECKVADKTLEKVVDSINENNPKKIKKLFSINAKTEIENLDEEILELLDYIQGDIVSCSLAIDKGVITSYDEDEKGRDIVEIESTFDIFTTEKSYYMAIREIVKDDTDSGNEGVIAIYIIDSENWWNYNVYRGAETSQKGIHIDRE